MLRFELQAKREWLTRIALISMPRDVTEELVETFARERWVWSGMGTPVAGLGSIVAAVQGAPWTDSTKSSFLGDVLRKSVGAEVAMGHSRTGGLP